MGDGVTFLFSSFPLASRAQAVFAPAAAHLTALGDRSRPHLLPVRLIGQNDTAHILRLHISSLASVFV